MVSANDAIAYARSLCGGKDKKGNWIIKTSYSEMDCIGLIKNIIWHCSGGVKDYRTSGTNTLWKSYDASPKYRDLTWRQEGIGGAKAGMLAFIESNGDVSHVGLVTGEGTIIHSSKSAGGVIESEFTTKRLWNKLAIHRHIGVGEVKPVEVLYTATVRTNGGVLNVRTGPGKPFDAIYKLKNGTIVNVLKDGDWAQIEHEGKSGYVDASFLERNEEPETHEETMNELVIVDSEGNVFKPVGGFRVYLGGID